MEIRVVVHSVNGFDNCFRVVHGEHVARVRSSVVEVSGKAMRRISSHLIGGSDVHKGAIHDTLLNTAFCHWIDSRIAIATEASSWVKDRRFGRICRIERPIPITDIAGELVM